MEPPPVVALEGWTPLSPLVAKSGRSFVHGTPGDERLRVAYFRREADGALVGRVWFGPWCEGPPGHAHGGSMAAVLDDAIGKVGWLCGHRVVAGRISVHFRKMLPLGSDVLIEAWVDHVDGRKVHTRGHLLDSNGEPYAEAEGLFIEIGEASVDRLGKAR
jgi:acyl-coenzyme A thioesterase PaaI-like protein